MGPTNVALVKLFQADQARLAAQERLDSASRSVRAQERRIAELSEKLRLAQAQLREQQARAGQLDLEIQSRQAKIDRLRSQQQNTKSLREYQVFLTEINTEKIDKGKFEDEALKVMESVEQLTKETRQHTEAIAGEQQKLDAMKQKLGAQLAELQGEVDRLKAARDIAAEAVPPKAITPYERLAERHEGEAMAPIGKPDRRREEYICTACNMSLVADIYNRLHSRDEPVVCPNCRRLLYIPDDLPPELAIRTRPVRKPAEAEAE